MHTTKPCSVLIVLDGQERMPSISGDPQPRPHGEIALTQCGDSRFVLLVRGLGAQAVWREQDCVACAQREDLLDHEC
jgi:serine/threonine protein phosphatase PrpC